MAKPITLTDAERAEYERLSAPTPVNPIRDFSSQDLADLATQDSSFDLAGEFRRNQDLWKDPAVVQKAIDAHNLIKQRGFKVGDIEAVKKAKEGNVLGAAGAVVKPVAEVGKGFLKQAWNYANAAAMPFIDIVGDITGQGPGFSEALAQEGQRRVAENIAGTEQAVTGLAELPGKAAGKIGRAVGLAKPFSEYTPEEKAKDFWNDVGRSETRQDIARGHGGFLTPVGGEVVKELEQAGKPVRPEETAVTAAGDPFSWWAFGKAFGAAKAPAPVARVIAKGEQVAGTAAAKAAGNLVQAAGAVTEKAITPALKTTGKVAQVGYPVYAAGKAIATGDFSGVFQHTAGGYLGGKALQRLGEGARSVGANLREFGKQVAGETPVTSNLTQLGTDVLQAAPGAAVELGKGAAFDLGLGAATSETPQETSGLGIGTTFGLLGAGKRIGGRALSGQLIAPRDYGIKTPVASSGQFPALDAMHKAAFAAAEPAQQARLNAIREFAKTAAPGADIFMGDSASIEKALTDQGVSPEQAKAFSQQEGFFTTDLVGKNGQPRRVVIVKDVAAAPHEAFHVIQDVIGEPGNRQIDEAMRQAYADRWDAEGTAYAQRLVGHLGDASWQEAILDASGWGQNEAKEKLFRDAGNILRERTGAEPKPEEVQAFAKEWLGQITDQALADNPGLSPEQVQARAWRNILSPDEARAVADRYIARELAAENFDVLFKHTGGKGTPPGVLPFLAEKVGQVVSAFGGEPLAGRVSEIGQIQPRTGAIEAVKGVTPRTAQTKPSVNVKAPVDEASKARQFADEAPDVPAAKGGRSQRELLGQMAEAISTKSGVKINYLSAPGEPAAATTSNRDVRRAIIETFRTMPPEARSLWEKSFFPDRVIKTKGGGYQVQGWAPEVFAANAHKLAETLAKAKAENLSPYAIDPDLQTFTPEAWQQLYKDAQAFITNQQAGRTGAGEPLVVPKEMTERGFFAPQVTPGAESPIPQRNADFINMLFGFKLPETPRIQKGKLPLNIAGQEVSAATKPGRVSVPVRPRGEFIGAEAERQGIAGREVAEVNPVRAEIERAATDAGVATPSFIEAIQKLNLENIKEVEGAPELPVFRGNTLTLTAGFQPRSAKEIEQMTPDEFRGWASKLPQGFTGAAHEMGRNIPSLEEARDLRAAYDRLTTKSPRVMQEARAAMQAGNQDLAMQKMDEAAAVASQAQFFREAAEAAEGSGSAAVVLKRDPNYVAPFPIEGQAQPKRSEEVTKVAEDYARSAGIELKPSTYAPLKEPELRRIADHYDAAKHNPNDAEVIASYDALARETEAQYRAIVDAGYKLEPWTGKGEPYKNSAEMVADVNENKHLFYLPSQEAFGAEAKSAEGLMLRPSEIGVPVNDIFRAVHDFFGHAKEGYQFGPRGEYNAWREHSQMYSDEAQPALAAETLAQNAWVNFGPHLRTGEGGRIPQKGEPGYVGPTERPFAEQKNIVLPRELIATAQAQPKKKADDAKFPEQGTSGGFKKVWILPNGKIEQLGPTWHHDWLDKHPEVQKKYGLTVPKFEGTDAEGVRESALQKGFVRANYSGANGLLTVEVRQKDWPKQKDSVQRLVESNLDDIDRARIVLTDDSGAKVVDSKTAPLFQLDTDAEKLAAIPFMEEAPRAARTRATDNPAFVAPGEEAPALRPDTLSGGSFAVYGADGRYVGKYLKIDEAQRAAGEGGNIIVLKGQAQPEGEEGPKGQIPYRRRLSYRPGGFFMTEARKTAEESPQPKPEPTTGPRKFGAYDASGKHLGDFDEPVAATKAAGKGGYIKLQAQPKKKQKDFSKEEVDTMLIQRTAKDFPESVIPKKEDEPIGSDIVGSPLYKKSKNEEAAVQAFADKLVKFANEWKDDPQFQAGSKWYSEFVPILKKEFGEDTALMAELLAATSPRMTPDINYAMAVDALEGFKSGRFDDMVTKYQEGLGKIADGSWNEWYAQRLAEGKVAKPPAKASAATFLAEWIDAHNLWPMQSNGKKFGMHSIPVLQVLARQWLGKTGLKTQNFVKNLAGIGHEATIDLWADRTMRRIGYEGEKRWRILPKNTLGVTDKDFLFSQKAFRRAAEMLDMQPDDLQGALWFAEKKLWADKGWSPLNLGDYRKEAPKTAELRARHGKRIEEQLQELIQPRKLK